MKLNSTHTDVLLRFVNISFGHLRHLLLSLKKGFTLRNENVQSNTKYKLNWPSWYPKMIATALTFMWYFINSWVLFYREIHSTVYCAICSIVLEFCKTIRQKIIYMPNIITLATGDSMLCLVNFGGKFCKKQWFLCQLIFPHQECWRKLVLITQLEYQWIVKLVNNFTKSFENKYPVNSALLAEIMTLQTKNMASRDIRKGK